MLFCQIIATMIAAKHPKVATVERMVKRRKDGTIYVDYLQNIRAKTVAAAYAVRARPGATVSTPLEWNEVDETLDPRDFTIETVPDRLRERGDIWARVMKKGNSVRALLDTHARKGKARR